MALSRTNINLQLIFTACSVVYLTILVVLSFDGLRNKWYIRLSSSTPSSGVKRIAHGSSLFGSPDWDDLTPEWSSGAVRTCFKLYACQLTKDISRADAVVFHARELGSSNLTVLRTQRTLSQRWVFFSWESIVHANVRLDRQWENQFNWTATYMRSSDVVTPYFRGYIPLSAEEQRRVGSQPLYDPGKKKKMAYAVISNCRPRARLDLIQALRRHIQVDVYGNCSTKINSTGDPFQELSSQYRFYLAFENSRCRDYITEKFWHNGLSYSAVPVVYGGFDRHDYDAVAPPHSFIYADDFSSVSGLAIFLKTLSTDEERYAKYFAWKEKFKVDNRPMGDIMMCHICQRLHTDRQRGTRNVSAFWDINKNCHPDNATLKSWWRYFI